MMINIINKQQNSGKELKYNLSSLYYLLFIIFSLAFTSCNFFGSLGGDPESLRPKLMTYTVTFNANGGTPVPEPQTVNHGGTVNRPETDPSLTGFFFGGWYREAGLTNPWVFVTDTVTGDTILHARWIDENATFTVTFNAGGGTPVPEPQAVNLFGKVSPPATPSNPGLVLAGWFTEANFINHINRWDFATDTVTDDLVLYARWIAPNLAHIVTFHANDGSPVSDNPVTVSFGDRLKEPAAMTRTDYVFDAWYRESAFTTKWIFTTDTITANTTLHAKWIPILYGNVSITGNAVAGQTLTADITALDGTGDVSFQWKKDTTVEIGTDSDTYILTAADTGSAVTVTVRRSGYYGSVTSGSTEPVKLPGAFTVTFAELQDLAPDITGPTIHLAGGEERTVKYITVTDPGQYDSGSIKWFFNGNEITGSDVSGSRGETLRLSSAVYKNIGTYFVTVWVRKDGRLYSKAISFEVEL